MFELIIIYKSVAVIILSFYIALKYDDDRAYSASSNDVE